MQFKKELEIVSALAREAGKAILSHYSEPVDVQYKDKAQSDPVTAADKDANAIIVKGLHDAFPDDAILAEESPANDARLGQKRMWCVDPLDGTREFLDHNGQFVVMIGLAIDGESRFGVVYQPTEGLLYAGADGEAFREDQSGKKTPLHVTTNENPPDAVMMVSRSHRSKNVTRVAQALGVNKESPLGSVGLKVARVCEGFADMYISVSDRTQEWDACAPEAILRAAGGMMTDTMGQPLRYNKKQHNTPYGIFASNGRLHPAGVDALRVITEERGWSKRDD